MIKKYPIRKTFKIRVRKFFAVLFIYNSFLYPVFSFIFLYYHIKLILQNNGLSSGRVYCIPVKTCICCCYQEVTVSVTIDDAAGIASCSLPAHEN